MPNSWAEAEFEIYQYEYWMQSIEIELFGDVLNRSRDEIMERLVFVCEAAWKYSELNR